MIPRPILWVSGALNLALAAGIFLAIRSRPAAVPGTQADELRAPPPTPTATEAEPPPRQPGPAPAGRPFGWSQIFSADLKVYRDNLRAAGCPALTAHDIILAEINERFDQRRQSLLAAIQSQFWNFALRGEGAIRNEWGQPVAALTAERQQMIDDVLGKDYGLAEAAAQSSREAMQRHLLWLPEEKRDRLFALEQRRQQRLEEWAQSVGRRPDGQLTAADNDRLQGLQKEFEDAKKELLAPEELEEARLRGSKESLWAIGLSGFEATEAEWRAVAKLRVDFEEAQRNLASPELSDEDRAKRQEELQAQLTRATKAALGAERFAQYELAGDGQFQEVYNVTQRYGLPEKTAVRAYEVQQAALAEAEKVRADPNLSPESRQAALTTLRRETESALARTLGEQTLATYREYSGTWLDELNRNEHE